MCVPDKCKARQVGDQMRCAQCGIVWDVTDPEPPTCRIEHREREKYLEVLKRRGLKSSK